ESFLTADLEVGKNTFQAHRYEPFVSHSGTLYKRGLLLWSQDQSASVITYKIPRGAKSFVFTLAAIEVYCGGGGTINGWTVIIKTPSNQQAFSVFHTSSDSVQTLSLGSAPPGEAPEISIAIDPMGSRTCDHSALGDPHFTFK